VRGDMKKTINELSINDFKKFPIWTWAEEDDESLVVPWAHQDLLEDHDAFFVLAKFLLKDKTHRDGFIAVRTSDLFVYLISISNEKGDLKDFSLRVDLDFLKNRESIAKHLKKQLDDIFPLRYYSNSLLPKLIEGIVP
jgi:hypothetical protein